MAGPSFAVDPTALDQKVIDTGTIMGQMYVQPEPQQSAVEDGPDGDIQKIDLPDADNSAMRKYWTKVEAIVDGVDAVRAGQQIYMPKFPMEDDDDYRYRLSCGTMTNVYRDIVEGLASKPFTQEVKLTSGESPELKPIVENINGRGDHMHVFLAEAFFRGINSAVHWILVDHPTVEPTPTPRSQADEAKLGLRPYWVQIRAIDVLSVKTLNMTGIEELAYVRIWETDSRVRVFDRRNGPVEWRIYSKDPKTGKWYLDKSGQITIPIIPMVPFQTGRRKGSTWQFFPPMRDAADLQIESYQAETGLKHARTLQAYAMLAANGVDPDTGPDGKPKPIRMGPNAVLYAPMNGNGQSGTWERLVTDAAGIKVLADDVKSRHDQMREIGRQPLTAQSGNVTRISAAFAASKSNSAVGAWAFGLKDAAEQALKITNMWLNSDVEPEVYIFTDFPIESDDTAKIPGVLVQIRAAHDISLDSYLKEMQFQGVFSSNFVPEDEPAKIALEGPTEEEIAAQQAAALGNTGVKKPGIPAPTPKPAPTPTKPV